MSRNLSATALALTPANLRAAEESVAYFKLRSQAAPKIAPSLTPLELMYAYYDAA